VRLITHSFIVPYLTALVPLDAVSFFLATKAHFITCN
jgi:hypothetical protein